MIPLDAHRAVWVIHLSHHCLGSMADILLNPALSHKPLAMVSWAAHLRNI